MVTFAFLCVGLSALGVLLEGKGSVPTFDFDFGIPEEEKEWKNLCHQVLVLDPMIKDSFAAIKKINWRALETRQDDQMVVNLIVSNLEKRAELVRRKALYRHYPATPIQPTFSKAA